MIESSDCYMKCVLCENKQERLIRHFVNQHKLKKEIGYLLRSYCWVMANRDHDIVSDRKCSLTFNDICKHVTSNMGVNALKALDSDTKQSTALAEVIKLYESRKSNSVDDNKRRLIAALKDMMNYFECNASTNKQRNNIATAMKHLFHYSIDMGTNCREIIELFTDDALNSLADNKALRMSTKDNYLCELGKVLDFLGRRCVGAHDVSTAAETLSALRASLRENVPDESIESDSTNDKLPKRASTKFKWNISAKRSPTKFEWEISPKRPRLKDMTAEPVDEFVVSQLNQTNSDSTASTKPKPAKRKIIFSKAEEELVKRFYMELYRQIVDNHSDGINKRNFYSELHRFESVDERLLECKQRVIDLPKRSALDKMHSLMRSRTFSQKAAEYYQATKREPLLPSLSHSAIGGDGSANEQSQKSTEGQLDQSNVKSEMR